MKYISLITVLFFLIACGQQQKSESPADNGAVSASP